MRFLYGLLSAIIQAGLTWTAKRLRPTAEDAHPDTQTKQKLQAQIRKHWGTSKLKSEDGWRQS